MQPSSGRSSPSTESNSAHADPAPEAAARLRILVNLSRQLAEAGSDLEVVLDAVAAHVVEVLGDGCAAYLRSEDEVWLEPVTIRHRDPARRQVIEEVNRSRKLRVGDGFAGKVVASGQPIYLPDADPQVLLASVVPEYVAYLERVGVRSLLVVPLAGKKRVHGALWLARDPGRSPYTQADRELVEAIADCAAMALESARLQAELSADRQRLVEAASQTAKLQEVTAALSSAVTSEEVATVVARIAVASMGGVAGSLFLPNGAQTELENVANVGHTHTPHLIKRFQKLPITADNPVARAYREGLEFYFEDLVRFGEVYPALLQATSEAGYQAAVALPLLARGEVLGVLWVRFATRRAFAAQKRRLMSTMVELSAQALERARLYTRAQQAVTLRDEFLSVAAHELRTPLAAMKLQIQSLQANLERSRTSEDNSARLTTKATAVARHVQRLELLVTDLLDLSRLTAGKLTLHIEELDLLEVVHEVRDRMADDVTRQGSTLEVHAECPAWGQWDRARLDQVLSNLLSNALKYGTGGPIAVTVTEDGPHVRLAVQDRGIGISPEDQVRIFDRFERAVPDRNYSGFGVGLWICKQIVAALGGRIQVQSRLGEGSTFEVTLPRSREP